jgi:hypothetical protein
MTVKMRSLPRLSTVAPAGLVGDQLSVVAVALAVAVDEGPAASVLPSHARQAPSRICVWRASSDKSSRLSLALSVKKEARSSGFRDHRPPDRDRCLCLWTPYLGTAFQA